MIKNTQRELPPPEFDRRTFWVFSKMAPTQTSTEPASYYSAANILFDSYEENIGN